jgi:hypothetical protein
MLGCDELIAGFGNDFAHSGNLIPLVAIVMGCAIGMVGIIGGTVRSVCKARAVEQTRRELAAYVAEGTLDPDKAIAMLNAGVIKGDKGCCC